MVRNGLPEAYSLAPVLGITAIGMGRTVTTDMGRITDAADGTGADTTGPALMHIVVELAMPVVAMPAARLVAVSMVADVAEWCEINWPNAAGSKTASRFCFFGRELRMIFK
jgi:hypothetical protein